MRRFVDDPSEAAAPQHLEEYLDLVDLLMAASLTGSRETMVAAAGLHTIGLDCEEDPTLPWRQSGRLDPDVMARLADQYRLRRPRPFATVELQENQPPP